MQLEDLAPWADKMRAAGIARFKDGDLEVELAPYMYVPAASAAGDDGEDDGSKPGGLCAHAGCERPSGWQYAPEFCRIHGLAALGVKGVPRD